MLALVFLVLLVFLAYIFKATPMKKTLLASLIITAITPVLATADNLDDVIVTATRSEIDTKDAPGSVTVINRKQIEQKGGESIVDLIRGTAGINLRGIGTGGRKSISLRGMEGRHTLVLVDGKRIPSTNDSFGPNTDYQYDWVSPENVERVEVVRGPMSVLYGADALGGVVNIITRKPSKKMQASVKAKGLFSKGDKEGNGHALELNLSGSVNDELQFSVSAQESRRASLESQLRVGQSSIEGRKKQQLTLGFNWQPAKNHNIKLDISDAQEDRWYDTVKVNRRSKTKTLYQSQYNIDREQVSLGWKGSYGDKSASLRAYQTSIDVSNKATNGVRGTAPQKLKDTTLEGSLTFPLGQKHFMTTGFEYRTEKLKNSRLKGGEDEVTLNSLYLQDEMDLTDKLVFTLGARLDDHEVFGNETSPRASLVWNATDKLTLKGSYGHGFRAPNIKQASADYLFALGIVKITGNPDLKPETNNAFELGVNYSADNYSVDAAIFDNKVKNLVELTGPITNRTYKNVAEARLKGIELSSNVNIREGLNLKNSYQYLDAKDGDGNRLKHRPRHALSSNVTWKKNTWKMNLGAEYISGQIVEHNNVSTDVPGYVMWNTGVQKAVRKNLDLALRIDNLTDVRLEDKSSAFLHEEYPRTISLELRGRF